MRIHTFPVKRVARAVTSLYSSFKGTQRRNAHTCYTRLARKRSQNVMCDWERKTWIKIRRSRSNKKKQCNDRRRRLHISAVRKTWARLSEWRRERKERPRNIQTAFILSHNTMCFFSQGFRNRGAHMCAPAHGKCDNMLAVLVWVWRRGMRMEREGWWIYAGHA